MQTFDTVIIGGGIIGCSLARLLAGEGVNVAIVERELPGEEASWAAAGMLAPSAEAEHGSPLFELCRASLNLYGRLAADLESETGIDPQYRTEGTLLIYDSEEDRQTMLKSVDWQRSMGICIDELSAEEVADQDPELAPGTRGFFLPEDHQVDNRLLMRALIESCRRRRVEFLLGKTVRELERNGNAVSGVLLDKDERIAAGRVVNTAGAWAHSIAVPGLPRAPIRPVKGHIIALENPHPLLHHVVRSHRVYLVPRLSGRVIVGSTMEEAGFDKAPRVAPVMRLLEAAQQLCPILAQSKIADLWAGLRPAAPDSLPLLGPTALPGYWLALGHFRNGILLAPVTARVLSSWLLTGKPSHPVDALLPQRFEK